MVDDASPTDAQDTEAARGRSRRRQGWLFALAAVVVVALSAVMGSHVIPRDVLDNLASASNTVANANQPNGNFDEPIEPEDDGAANAPVFMSPAAVPDAAADTDGTGRLADPEADDPVLASPDDDAQRQGMEDVEAAVRRATIQALDRGSPVRWHKDGLEGYVTVSQPLVTAERTCANVVATMGNGERQDRSRVHRWCQSDEGDWQPE